MNDSQARQAYDAADEHVLTVFKRHILEKTACIASEPMADLYRVNLLGMMLGRYEELREKGLSEGRAAEKTKQEYADIAQRMRQQGFEAADGNDRASAFSQMTDEEVQAYFLESNACLHRRSMGVALCTACLVPLMICMAISEFFLFSEDMLALFGVMGMFAMVGMGVYVLVTAGEPKKEQKIASLSRAMRSRLEKMRMDVGNKARKRIGKGVAMIVCSLLPVLAGAAVSSAGLSDSWPVLGVGGMFAMIAAGVYELVMAEGEKKAVDRLLKE